MTRLRRLDAVVAVKEVSMPRSKSILTLALAAALLVSGCAAGPMTQREQGALGGAMLGAGTGAIIGSRSGDAAEGALIGGAVGALAGAIIGDSAQARQQRMDRDRALAEELRRRDLDAQVGDRGVVVNLPDVLFAFGRAELTPGARGAVRSIADVLRSPGVAWRRVAIEGHTDSVGSDQANQRLSLQRARSVADGLAGLGVAGSRMTVQGFGESYPVAPNTYNDGRDNPAGRARNRRVEVVILNEQGAPQPVAQPQPMYAPQYPDPGYQQPPYGGYPGGGYPAPQPPPPAYPPYQGYPPGPPPYGY
jgi:outer membrane protein OmpA-like peptidoglycan-associated protein